VPHPAFAPGTLWLLIGFLIHHLYSALLTSKLERTGELDSMFSGNKFLAPDEFEAALETEGLRKKVPPDARR
jgi:hypothetical protein